MYICKVRFLHVYPFYKIQVIQFSYLVFTHAIQEVRFN